MYFLPGEVFDISTFNIRQKKWCSLGEIRFKIGEAIAHGGMRRAMKAVVLKRNDHPLLCHLTEGCTIVAKCYLDKVCEAVLQKGRELISIARKVIQIIGQLLITCNMKHAVLSKNSNLYNFLNCNFPRKSRLRWLLETLQKNFRKHSRAKLKSSQGTVCAVTL